MGEAWRIQGFSRSASWMIMVGRCNSRYPSVSTQRKPGSLTISSQSEPAVQPASGLPHLSPWPRSKHIQHGPNRSESETSTSPGSNIDRVRIHRLCRLCCCTHNPFHPQPTLTVFDIYHKSPVPLFSPTSACFSMLHKSVALVDLLRPSVLTRLSLYVRLA